MFGSLGFTELILILFVVLIIFGAGKKVWRRPKFTSTPDQRFSSMSPRLAASVLDSPYSCVRRRLSGPAQMYGSSH